MQITVLIQTAKKGKLLVILDQLPHRDIGRDLHIL